MMKKIKNLFGIRSVFHFLILMMTVFSPGDILAQDNGEDSGSDSESSGNFMSQISYGVKFGTVISEFTDQQPFTNINQGLMGGAFCAYDFSSLFSVQLDVNYIQQGGHGIRYDIPSFHGLDKWYRMKMENQDITMHNLELPLLAQVSFDLNETVLRLGVGPAFSYNLSTGVSTEGTVFASETDEFHTFTTGENISSVVNDYEYSAIGSIGFEFNAFDGFDMFVEGRYKYGLSDVYEGYSYVHIPQIQGDLKNHYMSFGLGVKF